MAQNITLMGASYTDVPSVTLPKTGGGTASFTDVSDTTAAAGDVASGKYFYTSAGVKTQGTSSGSGGGSSNWTLIKSGTLTVNTTSTSAGSAGTLECGSTAWTATDIIWVRIRGQSGKRAGYFYGSDAFFANYRAKNNSTSADSVPTVLYYRVDSGSTYTAASGSYGVYAYSINTSGTLTIRRRYNSTNTLTINDTFDIEVYKLTLPSNKALFA